MSRRSYSLLDLLAELPWQVSVVCSFCALIGFGFILPAYSNDTILAKGLSSFAWLIAFVLLLPGVYSFLESSRKKALLDTQHSLASIKELSWKEFEELLAEAFRRKDYFVTENKKAGADGGVDIVLHRDERKTLVQCKNWKKYKVDVKVVREMVGIMTAEGADEVIVVTSGSFTQPAIDFARTLPVQLIDGGQLLDMVTNIQPLDVQLAAANFGQLAVAQDDIRYREHSMAKNNSKGMFKKLLFSILVPCTLILIAFTTLPKFMSNVVENTITQPVSVVDNQPRQAQVEIRSTEKIEVEKKNSLEQEQLLKAKLAEKNAIDEEERIDQAFDDFYLAPSGCDNWESNDHMVECINDRMRAKKKFRHEQLHNQN